MHIYYSSLLHLAGVLVFTGTCVASEIVIDDFTEGEISYSTTGQNYIDGLDPNHVVGGARYTSFHIVGTATSAAFHIDSGFEITADPEAYKYFDIGYGIDALYPLSELPLNLDLSGKPYLQFEFQSSSIDVFHANARSIQVFMNSPSGGGNLLITIEDDLEKVLLPLSQLSDQGVDLSEVSSIWLRSSRLRSSFLINRIVAVPEPSSSALAFMLLIVFSCCLQRRLA